MNRDTSAESAARFLASYGSKRRLSKRGERGRSLTASILVCVGHETASATRLYHRVLADYGPCTRSYFNLTLHGLVAGGRIQQTCEGYRQPRDNDPSSAGRRLRGPR